MGRMVLRKRRWYLRLVHMHLMKIRVAVLTSRRLIVKINRLLHVVWDLGGVSCRALHADGDAARWLACLLEKVQAATCRVQLLLLVPIHRAYRLLGACIVALEMETASFRHVVDAWWRIARRNADSIARLLDLGLLRCVIHIMSSNMSCDYLWMRSSLFVAQVLIREIIIMSNWRRRRYHIRRPVLRRLLNLYLLGIMRLPRKHELTAHLISLVRRPRVNIWIAILFHFLNSVCVSEGVEGMLSARVGRTDICDHGCPTVSGERVSEHLRQLTSPKRQMLLL